LCERFDSHHVIVPGEFIVSMGGGAEPRHYRVIMIRHCVSAKQNCALDVIVDECGPESFRDAAKNSAIDCAKHGRREARMTPDGLAMCAECWDDECIDAVGRIYERITTELGNKQ